jgi:[1-hydroxy-2-(trimethylamino)ethyl]phosphonate dioxygenase
MTNIDTTLAEIEDMFAARGDNKYREAVTQREHALQAALQAEQLESSSALITAALLHDIGHMLQRFGPEPAAQGINDKHEDIGAGWLARHFVPDVVEPVRLHVDAKRYLCAVEPDYFATLSPASVRSLELQGGPMSPQEAQAFEAGDHFAAAVALRRWDEDAKVSDATTPDFTHYREHIRSSMRG